MGQPISALFRENRSYRRMSTGKPAPETAFQQFERGSLGRHPPQTPPFRHGSLTID
jgi:hypothetical protein